MPVFMKAGCNTGSCHGAARGKDGFRLSLFGFDPDGDHYRLTREMTGRRINLAVPAESLLLEKATGKVPHTGGKRFEDGRASYYKTLLRWLEAGAPQRRRRQSPTPVARRALPEERRARRQGRDAADDRPGQVLRRHRPRRDQPRPLPDEQRHLGRDHRRTAWSPPASAARRSSWPASPPSPSARRSSSCPRGCSSPCPSAPENNYIDTLVDAKLKKLRIAPSDVCTDEVFLRRVYLDIVGLLPTRRGVRPVHGRHRPRTSARSWSTSCSSRKEFAETLGA